MRIVSALILLVVSVLAASAAFTSFSLTSSGGGGGTATPTLIQHWQTTVNPVGSGQSGHNYIVNIQPTQSGDVLVAAIGAANGQTITVTDSAGDASPVAVCTADAGAGNNKSWIYAFVPTAGTHSITFSSASNFTPFDWNISEYNNIASVTAQGQNCQNSLTATATVVTPASFTPTNNDATGGNLIYNYTALATSPGCNASGYTPASGYGLLSGDTSSWINGNGFGYQKATQALVQTASASTAASMTMAGESCSGGNGDAFNSLTIALKAGSAGTAAPSGIHVAKILQLTSTNFGGPTMPATFTYPTPTTGNLRVWMFETPTANQWGNANTVTSSDGCNYTKVIGAATGDFLWYAQGCSPCPNCTTTFHMTAGGATDNSGAQFYDIQNAATSSHQTETDSSQGCSNLTSISAAPNFTPSNAVGLTIGQLSDGLGPVTAITSPSSSIFSCATYTNQNDGDYMCLGDGHGFFNHSTTAAQNWTWSITSQTSNTCGGMVADFK